MTHSSMIKVVPGWMLANQIPSVEKKFVPHIIGHPGCGKSDLAYQIALAIYAKLGVKGRFMTMFPSLDSPEDYKGMPCTLDLNKADFLPFGQLHEMLTSDELIVVFIDELSQAAVSVKNAVAQLILNREVNGKPLKNVYFMTAGNMASSHAGTTSMPSQLNDRLWTAELGISVEDWCRWGAKNNVTPEGVHFVKSNPHIVTDFDPDKARRGEKQSTARSYTRVDQVLYQNGLFDLTDNEVVEVVAGYIGQADAMDYVTFMEIRNKLPKFADIIRDPMGTDLPTDADVRFILTAKLASQKITTTEQWVDPIVQYITRMGEEQLACWSAELEVRNPEFMSTSAYGKLMMDNPRIFGTEAA